MRGQGAIRFGNCKRFFAEPIAKLSITLLSLVSAAGAAFAETSLADSPASVSPIDGCSVMPWAQEVAGTTASGIEYRMSRERNAYSDRYTKVTIQFARPMAAVGGWVHPGPLAMQTISSQLAPPRLINGTTVAIGGGGYSGVVANGRGFSEIAFVGEGDVALSRLDLRPVPEARPDVVELNQGETAWLGPLALLANDEFAHGAKVVRLPSQATNFLLGEDGSMIYRPKPGFSGVDSFSYAATNGGGTSVSKPITVQIIVNPSNALPEFQAARRVECDEDSGPQFIAGWATNIVVPDELDAENVFFEVSQSEARLFSVLPGIDAQGNLTFEPAPDASGTARISVTLVTTGRDVKRSAPFDLEIVIRPLSDSPWFDGLEDAFIRPGETVERQPYATEIDEGESLTYELIEGPYGAKVDAATGAFTWIAGEREREATHRVTIRCTDSSAEALAADVSFYIVVEFGAMDR